MEFGTDEYWTVSGWERLMARPEIGLTGSNVSTRILGNGSQLPF